MSKISVSGPQFYAACKQMEKHRDEFFAQRPTQQEAAKMLSQWCGFAVPLSAVARLQQATGIVYVAKRTYTGRGDMTAQPGAVRVLTRAVFRLYRKLGEEVPSDLQALSDAVHMGTPPVDRTITTDPIPAPRTNPPVVLDGGITRNERGN